MKKCKPCKYCKKSGRFDPVRRKILCEEHRIEISLWKTEIGVKLEMPRSF